MSLQVYPLWDRTQVAKENISTGYSYISPNASILASPDFSLCAPAPSSSALQRVLSVLQCTLSRKYISVTHGQIYSQLINLWCTAAPDCASKPSCFRRYWSICDPHMCQWVATDKRTSAVQHAFNSAHTASAHRPVAFKVFAGGHHVHHCDYGRHRHGLQDIG
jgi:hypothetical protein